MRVARIQTLQGPKNVALVEGRWKVVKDIYQDLLEFTSESFEDNNLIFLTPTEPRVILGMAHNGSKADFERPPQAFHKSARSVVGPGAPIVKDESLGRMDVECELVTVIKKTSSNLTNENAMEHVLGFSIGNDVTMAEQTPLDNLLLQTKNGAGFTPYGPWIETELLNPNDISLHVSVNGNRVISSSTNQLARGIIEQLVYITKYTTLGAGDIIFAGSPKTWYAVNAGDTAVMEIDGIGSLSNPVVKL